jgi:hypothetical protein
MGISQQLAATQQKRTGGSRPPSSACAGFPAGCTQGSELSSIKSSISRLLTTILGCKLPKRRTVLVKNPYIVLSQKERDVARVRIEIQALLTVIPLLADSPPSWDELQTQLLSSCPDVEHSVKDGIAALELYYPFVRNLQEHSLDVPVTTLTDNGPL